MQGHLVQDRRDHGTTRAISGLALAAVVIGCTAQKLDPNRLPEYDVGPLPANEFRVSWRLPELGMPTYQQSRIFDTAFAHDAIWKGDGPNGERARINIQDPNGTRNMKYLGSPLDNLPYAARGGEFVAPKLVGGPIGLPRADGGTVTGVVVQVAGYSCGAFQAGFIVYPNTPPDSHGDVFIQGYNCRPGAATVTESDLREMLRALEFNVTAKDGPTPMPERGGLR